MASKTTPDGSKMAQDGFLKGQDAPRGLQEALREGSWTPKSLIFLRKTNDCLEFSLFQHRTPQDTPKGPKRAPREPPGPPKTAQESPLGAQEGPRIAQDGPRRGPRGLPEAPQRASKTAPTEYFGPNGLPDPSGTPLGPLRGPSRTPPGLIFSTPPKPNSDIFL